MNQVQLGLMLKDTWEKVRWIHDHQAYRWKDGDVHLSLTLDTRTNNLTGDSIIDSLYLSVRDVDKANPATDRIPMRAIGKLLQDHITTSEARSWLVKCILTEQFK